VHGVFARPQRGAGDQPDEERRLAVVL
jgi:hypothetical protein